MVANHIPHARDVYKWVQRLFLQLVLRKSLKLVPYGILVRNGDSLDSICNKTVDDGAPTLSSDVVHNDDDHGDHDDRNDDEDGDHIRLAQ